MNGHAEYLVHLVGWSLPVLMLQWAWGRAALWRQRRAVLVGALGPAALLSAADSYAIREGIWGFDPEHLLGLDLGGVPVEEVLFFAVTALLVAQSVALMAGGAARPGPSTP
jgi:lycopene cyclase domain-containing protein